MAAFAANTGSRLLSTAVQLVSVPVFLSHWGSALYGEWILLNSIPSYFTLSEMGFGSVAANEMTMLMGAQKQAEALAVFQSVWVLITSISAIAGALLFASVRLLPLDRWLHIHLLSQTATRHVILLLGVSVLFSMQEILFAAAFRCVGLYAYGTWAKSTVQLATFAAMMIAVLLHASPSGVAAAFMASNAAGTGLLWCLLRRKITWIRLGSQYASWEIIRRLASPAIAFMSFPITNAITIQGPLMIVGALLGPSAVVVFSTARTISRSAGQAIQLINNSIWPELSNAFGAGNVELAKRLHRRACQLSILLCATVALTVAAIGPAVWKIWTLGKVHTDTTLLTILLAQLFVSSFWFTSAVVPVAINRHQRMASMILISSALSLPLAWLLVTATPLGLRGPALALAIVDLTNAAYVSTTSLALLNDNSRDFWRSMLEPAHYGNRYIRKGWIVLTHRLRKAGISA